MNQNMNLKLFSDINLDDPFFDSLKSDYPGFENWFQRKINENEIAFVQYKVSNHHFKWWFDISPQKGCVTCTPKRRVSQANCTNNR